MAARPFRILQVGQGNRGQMWSSIVDRTPSVELSGVVDINPQALAAFSAKYPQVPCFTDLAAALASTSSDAVLLVTPPDGHLAQARQIFAAGLPLLAEKPLTLDLDEAVTIVDMAARAQIPLVVGLNFRYLSVSQKIRELVTTRAVGVPGFGQFTYQRNRDGKLPWLNKYPLTMQHPMMLEQSIHHLDLIRFCYGSEVESVMCHTWNPPWSMYAHDSNVSCLLRMQNGMEVNYLGTWTGGWNELRFEWRTDCTEGVIVQRELFADLAMAHMTDKTLTPVPLPYCEPFYDDSAALLRSFVAHVRDRAPVECSGADHLITLGLCFAAIESSATGRAVNMADFCARHGIAYPS